MKQYKVTVFVEVPFETYVVANSEEEAEEIALGRDVYVPYIDDVYKADEFILGDIYEFPNLGKDERPEVEEYEDGELFDNED